MREYIRNLRKKDEAARKRILYVSMAVSMFLVVVVWIYGLGYRFNHNKQESIAKTERQTTNPLNLFKNSVLTAYKNISASVGSIPSITKLTEEEVKVPEKQINLIVVEEQ